MGANGPHQYRHHWGARARARPCGDLRQAAAGAHRGRLRYRPGAGGALLAACPKPAKRVAKTLCRYPQDARKTATSTPSPSPHPTTGTRSPPSGRAGGQGRVRGKARLPQHLRGPQDGGGRAQVQPHGAGGNAEPVERAQDRGHPAAARRRHRQGLHGQGHLLQAAQIHRQGRGRPGAARHRLRHLARARPHAPLQPQPLPLQLALVLGDRQRRYRQPGGARNGHCPLGARQGHPARTRGFHGRQVHLRR